MMNLYEAIGCRHSVRKYTDREVTEKLRGQILSYFDKTSRLNDRIRVEAVIFLSLIHISEPTRRS